jgi:hypothetical protein
MGMGVANCIQLILIFQYGAIYLQETNSIILYTEIVLTTLIIILAIIVFFIQMKRLLEKRRDDQKGERR